MFAGDDLHFAGEDLHVSGEHRKDDAMTTALRAARADTSAASLAHDPVARLMAELDAMLVIDGDEPLRAGLALLDGGASPSPERTAAFAAHVAQRARTRRYAVIVADG